MSESPPPYTHTHVTHTLTCSRAGVIAVIYVVCTREDATVQEEESPAQSARRLAVCTTDTLRDETAAKKKMREKTIIKIILLL